MLYWPASDQCGWTKFYAHTFLEQLSGMRIITAPDFPIGFEMHLITFDTAPYPLDKNVMEPAALPSMMIQMSLPLSTWVSSILENWIPWSIIKNSEL